MSLTLWGRPTSANVQKVLWALDEFGLPFGHRIVGGRHGGLDTPEFAALTPAARVPVLQDGDRAVWESHAILRHLARREAGHPLAASLPDADPWLDWGATTLQPPFIALFWQRVRMPVAQRSADRDAAALRDLTAALATLDRGLAEGRPGIGGPDLSLADIGLGSLMFRIFDIAPDLAPAHPDVAAWTAALARRPAWSRHIATSYDELRA